MTESESEDHTYNSKVSNVARRYQLNDINETLVDLWTRDDDRYSLRDLAEYFNEQIIAAAMKQAGIAPLDGEAANTLRLLTDDDVSGGQRTQVRRRLEQEGVDVEQLVDDLVSYQAINRHLKKRLNVDRAAGTTDSEPEAKKDRILALQNRTERVTTNTLEQLTSVEGITVGNLDVFVDITITCSDCMETLSVREFFDQGGCECTQDST